MEPTLRLSCFVGALAFLSLWELTAPRRGLMSARTGRWLTNLGLMAFNTACVRLLLPISAVAAAIYASEHHWGVLNSVDCPRWIKDLSAVVILDLLIYLQHVIFHLVPWLWRIHRLHHLDVDLDVTTAVRFHTLEIVLSALVKVTAVLLIGCSVASVIAFEILLNAMAMLTHSNVRFPDALDRWLRLVIVTPDMHLIHHSTEPGDHHRNFGFNLSWWDYLYRTYRNKSPDSLREITIGLKQ